MKQKAQPITTHVDWKGFYQTGEFTSWPPENQLSNAIYYKVRKEPLGKMYSPSGP